MRVTGVRDRRADLDLGRDPSRRSSTPAVDPVAAPAVAASTMRPASPPEAARRSDRARAAAARLPALGVDRGLRRAGRRAGCDSSTSTRALRRMSTVDDGRPPLVHAKGAPEEILPRCARVADVGGDRQCARGDDASPLRTVVADDWPADGLRVLAVACRRAAGRPSRARPARATAERDLTLPRPRRACSTRPGPRWPTRSPAATAPASGSSSSPATTACTAADDRPPGRHRPGRRPRRHRRRSSTRCASASSTPCSPSGKEIVFARSSPEAKLRIADALRAEGTSSR